MKRKKAASKPVIQISKLLIKPLLLLVGIGVVFSVYYYRQALLEALDQKPISAFALIGQARYTSHNDIRDILLKYGSMKGYFSQDVVEIKEQIELTPWIKRAVVRKVYPDQLNIQVVEYNPVAKWNKTDLLADDGTIFSLPSEKLGELSLPDLSGPDFQGKEVLNAWYKIKQELDKRGMQLASVLVDTRGSWTITLSSGIMLKLGRGEWKDKIDRFTTVYSQINVPEHKQIDYVDLRYNSAVAVSFKESEE